MPSPGVGIVFNLPLSLAANFMSHNGLNLIYSGNGIWQKKIRLSMPLDFETYEESYHWYQIFKWWVVGIDFSNNNRLNPSTQD